MHLKKSKQKKGITLPIGGSKSITNRLLILQKLFGNIQIENSSDSQDSALLKQALNSENEVVDVYHAGTAMRFLTSYYAIQDGKTTILTGSERMKQRPIKYLVEALRSLGANIEYLEDEGFPPLKIEGSKISRDRVSIPANVSSQFITSLLLIAGKLPNGLHIELTEEITSRPYLEMTLAMLKEIGISCESTGNTVKVYFADKLEQTSYTVESDWSSASYFYSLAAIGRQTMALKSLKKDSLQGDAIISELYGRFFGIETRFLEHATIELVPQEHFQMPTIISIDMNTCPDIAQTLCVTAAALKIPFEITGLATLKVKETDRLIALQNELAKIGCETEITDESIKTIRYTAPKQKISIATYNDHRMAMCFAPYCLVQELTIQNPEVVEKSYPLFWKDLAQILLPA